MPRCANGTRRNKKTGNCEPNRKKSKRCAKGTRKNKKTGNCEPVKKSTPVKSSSTVDATWRIHKIDYVFPTIDVMDFSNYSSNNDYGINIENVFFANARGDLAQLIFPEKEIVLSKKNDLDFEVVIKFNKAKQEPVFKNLIAAGLNSRLSEINFVGYENDDDNNHSTNLNIHYIKSENYGK